MDLDLTNGQYAARSEIFNWYREGGDDPFFLGGYAGSGKTTLIKHLIGEARGHIAVLAPTNKAAKVLRGKGVPQAQTIHSFLYGQPVFGECECGSDNKNHDARCPALKMSFLQRGLFNAAGEIVEEVPPVLIIVDEASMVNEKMAKDLIAKGVPILAVGDPGQLPPVEGKPGFGEPTYVLTEIMRQAAENPIIQLAHAVRNGESLRPGKYGRNEEAIITKMSPNRADWDTDEVDQILTWKHTTRTMYNRNYRALTGRQGLVEPGEDVLFKSSHKEQGIANGDVFTVCEVIERDHLPNTVELRLAEGPDRFFAMSAWKQGFGGAQEWKDLSTMDFRYRVRHAQVWHSYAITVHSAQGSEWDHVLIAQDGNRDRKWLYTAITRAKERMMLCLGTD